MDGTWTTCPLLRIRSVNRKLSLHRVEFLAGQQPFSSRSASLLSSLTGDMGLIPQRQFVIMEGDAPST